MGKGVEIGMAESSMRDSPSMWRRHLLESDAEVATSPHLSYSLPALWLGTWRTLAPKQVLMVDTVSGDTISVERFESETAGIARHLRSLGADHGQCVVLSIASQIDLITWHVGVLRSGAISVPVNPQAPIADFRRVIASSAPLAVVSSDVTQREILKLDPNQPRALDPRPLPSSPTDLDIDKARPEDGALMLFTSGTTGRPKGVLLSHRNLSSSIESFTRAWRWSVEDNLALCLPLFHLHGLGVAVHGSLAMGSQMSLAPRFASSWVCESVREARSTMFFGVPTMYHRLVESPGVSELSGMRLMVSGSAPLPSATGHALEKACGQRVLERYGMSETVMNLSNPYEGERRLGSIGFELPGVSMRLSEGDSGEILLRGDNVFSNYWHDETATAEAFDDCGWFKTGDIGRYEDDGYVRLVGRSKELIISGGYNVYPREVEECICQIPGVREAAVIGVPSLEWGEKIVGYVVADDSRVTEEVVLRHCRENLLRYKVPASIALVGSLPRNHLGKILRDRLREDA